MCKQSESQVLNLLTLSETTVINLLTEAKVISTAEAQKITTDYTAAITAVQNWKSGTPATNILEIVQAIQSNLQLIPIPAPFNLIVPEALAGLEAILVLLGANSPAPATEATGEEVAAVQTIHAHAVAAAGEAKVTELTGYKPSLIDKARASLGDTHVAANKYAHVWNAKVESAQLPAALKVA